MTRLAASIVAVTAISIGVSLASLPLMALMFLMPLCAAIQQSRLAAYSVAVAYYAGASWALVPAARNFFGPHPAVTNSVVLWIVASALLAVPWGLVWSASRTQIVWRIPLGLLTTLLPPLGLIGWASPLTSAGILFPATGWPGLVLTAMLPGLLVLRPRVFFAAAAGGLVLCNVVFTGSPALPLGWEAVDTNFGGIAHTAQFPWADFSAAWSIQGHALATSAHVVVFPETVIPMWTEATDLFWQQTLAELRASGKTIVIGVGRPMTAEQRVPPVSEERTTALRYRNTVLIAGAGSGVFFQRIPVPLGMWKPFSASGVPLNLAGPGTVEIAGRRAAVLICYEELLAWPILQSMAGRPSVVLTIANDYWATNTPIPRCQAATIKAWCRLFDLPFLSATNR